MSEFEKLQQQVIALQNEIKEMKRALPYRVLGNSVEFDKILIAKNRLIVPEKEQDSGGRNGEIIVEGGLGLIRANDTWKVIT